MEVGEAAREEGGAAVEGYEGGLVVRNEAGAVEGRLVSGGESGRRKNGTYKPYSQMLLSKVSRPEFWREQTLDSSRLLQFRGFW